MLPGFKDCRVLFFMAGLAVCLPGCSSDSEDAGKYASVSGRVTYQQKPLEGATVTFVPVDMSANAQPATGITDDNGAYVLLRQGATYGARVGNNLVVVEKRGPPKPIDPRQSGDPVDTESPGDPLVPKKYLSASTTDLKFEVNVGGHTDANFDLVD